MDEVTLAKGSSPSTNSLHLSRIRLFGLYIHSQFLLLLILEVLISALVVYVGGLYLDLGLTSFQFDSITYYKVVSIPLVLSLSMAGVGLYSSSQPRDLVGILLRFAAAVLLCLVVFSVLHAFLPAMTVRPQQFLLLFAGSLVGLALIRFLFYRLLRQTLFERRVLVIGTGHNARLIEQIRTRNSPQNGFDLIGFIDPLNSDGCSVDREKVFARRESLYNTVRENRINEIVVALDDRRCNLPTEELIDCKFAGVKVSEILDFLERESGKVYFELLHPSWLIYSAGFRNFFFSNFLKRVFDVVCSILLLILTAPIFVATVIAIWLEDRGRDPIFYQQSRVGLMNQVFPILKFRSMKPDAEIDGAARWAEEDDPRVTRVGGIIRKYRIDELPQLLNVLLGHMSLVGPRPERPEIVSQLEALNKFYYHRHRVKPGLTGWAQLRFKYGASEANALEKLQYDIYYIKNKSILFDLYILILTVEVVLFRKGSR